MKRSGDCLGYDLAPSRFGVARSRSTRAWPMRTELYGMAVGVERCEWILVGG